MMIIRLICVGASFSIGYLVGAREGADAIRLSDLAFVLLEYIMFAVALSICCLLAYSVYVRFAMTSLQVRKQEIDKELDTLRQEEDKFHNVEMPERRKNLIRLNEEHYWPRLKHAISMLEVEIRGELEVKYQLKYQVELQLLKGMRPKQIQGRKIVKKTLDGAPQLYVASNGMTYARLKEGPPIS